MKIDITPDLGIEDVTVVFGDTEQTNRFDVFLLSDRLAGIFARAEKENALARDVWPLLRAEWENVGFRLPEQSFNAAYAASQRLICACKERKKKFEDNLWGTGDELPA